MQFLGLKLPLLKAPPPPALEEVPPAQTPAAAVTNAPAAGATTAVSAAPKDASKDVGAVTDLSGPAAIEHCLVKIKDAASALDALGLYC